MGKQKEKLHYPKNGQPVKLEELIKFYNKQAQITCRLCSAHIVDRLFQRRSQAK